MLFRSMLILGAVMQHSLSLEHRASFAELGQCTVCGPHYIHAYLIICRLSLATFFLIKKKRIMKQRATT